MRGMIAWLVDQLQKEIKKECGADTRIRIIAHDVTNKDMADRFAHKIARHFDDSKIQRRQSGLTNWINVEMPYDQGVDITAFYEGEEGDSHSC